MSISSKPKILIGTYTYDGKKYAIKKFMESVTKMMDNYEGETSLLIIDNSKTSKYSAWLRLFCDTFPKKDKIRVLYMAKSGRTSREKQKRAQDLLWETTLVENYDYLFVNESDVYCPKNTLNELISHKKKIISGFYSLANDETGPILCMMGFNMNAKGNLYWEPESSFEKLRELSKGSPISVYQTGLGCVLIHRTILNTIKPEYATNKTYQFWKELESQFCKLQSSRNIDETSLTYLKTLIKKLKDSTRKAAQKKIHPDSAFHRNCELYKVKRYVTTNVYAEHDRSNWSECTVPR